MSAEDGPGRRPDSRLLLLGLATIGFTAIITQLLMMREIVAAFYGNELLIGVILAVWMAWTALGAAMGTRVVRAEVAQRLGAARSAFAAGLGLVGLLLPATLAAVRGSRSLLGLTPGVLVGFVPTLGVVIAVLAPFCLISGALFTLGVTLATGADGGAGRAYAWESTGAVLGGGLFSFLLIRFLDAYQIALLCALVNWTVALGILLTRWATRIPTSAPPTGRLARKAAPLLLFLLLAPLTLILGPALNQATLRWQWPHLLYSTDSPYGRVTVEALGGERVFYVDGMLAFESQGVEAEEVAHFPLLAHPDPRRVLLIGGGVAGDLREILKHPVGAVTYVELDPALIDVAARYLPPSDAAVLQDPRVQVVMTDGRRYVSTTAERFDAIILDLPEPVTGALNRFYTEEFFAAVRVALRPGGIFSLHLPSAENYWSPELTRRNASIYRTLQTAFTNILVLPGDRDFLLASTTPLPADPSLLAGRLLVRRIATRWVTPDYLSYILTTDRFGQVMQALESAGSVRLNRDLYPISYYYGQSLWTSMLSPELRVVLDRVSLINLWWLAVPFILATATVRWRRSWSLPFAAACAGLAGMLFELVILFAFQGQHGSLYSEVGLIVAAYMGGLAAGASVANRQRGGDRGPLLGILGLAAAFAGLIALLMVNLGSLPELVFVVLALVAGCLGGAVYPFAVRAALARSGTPGNLETSGPSTTTAGTAIAGRLYAVDLLGGCLAALTGATLLVPVLGIPQTCVVITLAALAGLAAIV